MKGKTFTQDEVVQRLETPFRAFQKSFFALSKEEEDGRFCEKRGKNREATKDPSNVDGNINGGTFLVNFGKLKGCF